MRETRSRAFIAPSCARPEIGRRTIAWFIAVAAIVLALPGAWMPAAVAACFGLYAAARYIECGVRQLAASYRERLASE